MITTITLTAALALTPTTTDDVVIGIDLTTLPYWDQYTADRVCFALTYEAATGGPVTYIPVIDTFERVDALNAGTTSATFAPCIPTDCPEPFELVSGNVCATADNNPLTAVTDTLELVPFTDGDTFTAGTAHHKAR